MKRKLLYFEILRKEKKKEPFRPGSVIGLISKACWQTLALDDWRE